MIPGVSTDVDNSLAFVEGDTWGGIPAFSYTVDDVAPSADAASAKMQFRVDLSGSSYVKEITSAGGGITITSANGWTFAVPAQALTELKGGNIYQWGIQVTDVNGVIQTILQGKVSVLPKVIL